MSRQKPLKPHKKSYYPFSKDYPGRAHSSFAIGETRERRKKEQHANILYVFSMFLLFLCTFFLVYLAIFLSKKPIQENQKAPLPSLEQMVALEMPKDALSGGIALDLFRTQLQDAGANAVFVEFKDEDGHLNYVTNVETASQIGASNRAYQNFADSLAKLKAEGYKIIATYSCFQDALAASSLSGAAITLPDYTSLWLDESAQKDGSPWLNPYAPVATDYLLSLIAEAKSFGADGILLKHVEFPTGRFIEDATYPFSAESGLSKNAVLLDFLSKVALTLGDMPFSVELDVADVLYGNPQKHDGSLLESAVSFFTIEFEKTPDLEQRLLENNTGFATLSQTEYFLPAAAAVKTKLEATAAEKPIVVRTTPENPKADILQADFSHVCYVAKENT